MKIAVVIARVLMGLMFLNASIGYFFNLYPAPPKMPDAVVTYMNGMSVVHLMDIVKSIELVCAIAFLAGRYVSLAAAVLLPITFNIVLLHATIGRDNLPVAVGVLIVHLFLIYAYRKHYSGMFVARRME